MSKILPVTSFQVYFAACSQGFNEWRQNIIIRTKESNTICDLRFVDDPATVKSLEKVRETGPSQLYLPTDNFSGFLELLRTEKPLFVVLYADANRAIVQTGNEPPGEGAPDQT
jgi:hypothetical protein